MQDHPRAARGGGLKGDRLGGVGALAIGDPAPALGPAGLAGLHHHFVGDHEGRIEADAELADEIGAGAACAALRFALLIAFLFGVGADALQKGAGAGIGDGAKGVHEIGAAHADAVICDGEGSSVLVQGQLYGEGGLLADQGRVGQRLVAQHLAGVGAVGDQFAQEDVPVRIDRMHHQVQKAGNISLKGVGLGVWRVDARRHCKKSP